MLKGIKIPHRTYIVDIVKIYKIVISFMRFLKLKKWFTQIYCINRNTNGIQPNIINRTIDNILLLKLLRERKKKIYINIEKAKANNPKYNIFFAYFDFIKIFLMREKRLLKLQYKTSTEGELYNKKRKRNGIM